jgi:hypothetical protein
VRSFLLRFGALVASVALVACGGSSSSAVAEGDTVLASIVAPGLASTAVAGNRQGAIWLVWTERQVGPSGAVSALRIRSDGRTDRWSLARDETGFGVFTLNFVDDRPLVGWYQTLPGGRYGVRAVSWDGAGWRDEITVPGEGVTSDFQIRVAPDGTAWLLVTEQLPLDGGSRCSVRRRLSPGTWGSPIEVVTTQRGMGARCVMAPGHGGELMAAWTMQDIASTAPTATVRAAVLPSGAQRFGVPSVVQLESRFIDRLESVGAARWALLWYAPDGPFAAVPHIQLYRGGQWSRTAHPVGVSGETNYGLVAVANERFVDLAWAGIREGDSPGGSAPRATRFDADTDTLLPTQFLGRFNPDLLIATSFGAAPDGRIAAGFSTVRGPGEAWVALADGQGLWRPAFRIGDPSRGATAPTALSRPDGSWAAVWTVFSAESGAVQWVMRRVQ